MRDSTSGGNALDAAAPRLIRLGAEGAELEGYLPLGGLRNGAASTNVLEIENLHLPAEHLERLLCVRAFDTNFVPDTARLLRSANAWLKNGGMLLVDLPQEENQQRKAIALLEAYGFGNLRTIHGAPCNARAIKVRALEKAKVITKQPEDLMAFFKLPALGTSSDPGLTSELWAALAKVVAGRRGHTVIMREGYAPGAEGVQCLLAALKKDHSCAAASAHTLVHGRVKYVAQHYLKPQRAEQRPDAILVSNAALEENLNPQPDVPCTLEAICSILSNLPSVLVPAPLIEAAE